MTPAPKALKVAKELLDLFRLAESIDPKMANWSLQMGLRSVSVADLKALAAYALKGKANAKK